MLSRWDLSPHLLWEIRVDQFINYLLKSFFFFHTVSYHREDKIKSIKERKNTCSWNQLFLESLKTVWRNLILLCLMFALLFLKITSLAGWAGSHFKLCCLLRNSGPSASVQDKYLRLIYSLGIATQNYPASSNNLAAGQETISCSWLGILCSLCVLKECFVEHLNFMHIQKSTLKIEETKYFELSKYKGTSCGGRKLSISAF